MKSFLVIASLVFATFAQAATITQTTTNLKPAVGNALMTVWSPMATGDVGSVLELPSYKMQSVQITGTFGAGAVNIEGSLDGVTWFTMIDSFNGALTFTAASIKEIGINTRYMRVSVVGGAASGIKVVVLSIR